MRANRGRVIVPELLDAAPDAEARRNLAELVFLNRWFGGHRVLRGSLEGLYQRQEAFTMLDVGAATGDVARTVAKTFPHARVTCLDWQHRNLRDAPAPKVAADAFALPFPDGAFDVVHCALFLHHFNDAQVVDLLSKMARCARRAVVVQDLERHPLAYYFLPATAWLLRWSPLVLHDGPVSVEAAFHATELRALAQQAGLQAAEVRSHRPWFRLSLVAEL
ncbi:MAG: methyltransferase domain-containing protein [Bryobacteraceae bacterium]|nr:methyltransferase domain-containing protein [Bryobacteraceae bacterium]